MPIGVIPEIAAEVVAYACSARRKDGLYIVVDVGASTLDICGFVVHAPDDEDRYELLTALVERLGAHQLHLKRLSAIRKAGATANSNVSTNPDPLRTVPEAGREYVDAPPPSLLRTLNEIDERYVKECANAIMKVLVPLRKKRDPHSPEWESGLPMFIAGGGSRLRLVKEAVDRADKRIRDTFTAKGGIDPRLLSTFADDVLRGRPGNGTAPPPAAMRRDMTGRLDVAYGLSFEEPDIGEITPPHKIGDVDPPPRRRKPEPPSKDQV